MKMPTTGLRPQVRALVAAFALPALLAAAPLAAKTLVYCSEGSPENFYPAVNTTGTSFDANSQIYGRIVDVDDAEVKVKTADDDFHVKVPREVAAQLREGDTVRLELTFKPSR